MSAKYKKRAGTSGIGGQLYETNLISLILMKLYHDNAIDDFILASNMDDIGAFDDICLKVKIIGRKQPLYVFIQAKHKEVDASFLNYEINKQFYGSYVKIKQNFHTNKDDFFKENFDESDIVFVLYTNAKFCDDTVNIGSPDVRFNINQNKQKKIVYKNSFSDKLNGLIATGENGSQLVYTEEDLKLVNDIIVEEEIITISEHLAKFLSINDPEKSLKIFLDDGCSHMLQYHVILAKTIVNVSKVQINENNSLQWRDLTFNSDFFNSDERIIKLFRHNIYAQVIKTQVLAQGTSKKEKKPKKKSKSKDADKSDVNVHELFINNLVSAFLSEPSAHTLSPLIGAHIIFKNDRLEFANKRSLIDIEKLDQIKIVPDMVKEAEEIAATNILSQSFKVPVSFGNLDLTIAGDEKKVIKRITHLTKFFYDLCVTSNLSGSYEISIDKSAGDILGLNGGIGSGVGNLLVYDKVTKLLMFTEQSGSLPYNAQLLFACLSSLINNLHLYRFNVKSLVNFPKLVFDFIDEAKQVVNYIVIFDKQGNHKTVAEELDNEMKKHHITKQYEYNIPVKPETISLNFHHHIQIWWMSLKAAIYLTKFGNHEGSFQYIYQQAINNIVNEPQISAMQTSFYMINLNYFRYNFDEHSINSLVLLEIHTITIIATEIPTLTTVKVIQCLRDKYTKANAVLDLEYILKLKETDFNVLKAEVGKSDKVLIVVCNKIANNKIDHSRLDQISKAAVNRKVIVVINKAFVNVIKQYFSSPDVINDDKQSLVFFTEDSQKEIIDNAQVIFQGEKVSLSRLVDDKSIEFIKGAVFNKIVCNESIRIGKSLSSSSYEEIKQLYVDRKVSRTENIYDNVLNDNNNTVTQLFIDKTFDIKTFYDIHDNNVLLTAKPGMGKSTLLTHLSIKTQDYDMKNNARFRWIERINLLDHSKVFHNWQKYKTELNTLESLKFICQAILKNSLLDHSKFFYNWDKDIETGIDTLETLRYICQAILKNNNINVNLEEKHNKVYLSQCTGDEWATFELNMFLHFYNEKKIIFAFDGFDEVCPHYKDSVIKLFDVIRNYPQKNKIWVASRPYTEILPDLERVLGKSYVLQFIDDADQDSYLKKYWQENIKMENFCAEQYKRMFASPDEFLNTLPAWKAQDEGYVNLQRIYYHLRNYLYNKLSLVDKDKIINSRAILYTSEVILDPSILDENTEISNINNAKQKVNEFLGTPLLLYLLADYFVNLIDDINSGIFKSNINVFIIYKQFIERKLKRLLKDKLRMDVYMPGVISRYEQDLTICISMHKKLAASVIFQSSFLNRECRLFEFEDMRPFSDHDTSDFEDIVKKIKIGTERTGLISYVTTDNIPVFIHRTFAEYFASEYVSDIFKSNKYDNYTKKLLFTTIYLFNTNDVFPWICRKRELDSQLRDAITNDFISTMLFSICKPLFNHKSWSIEQFIRIMSSSTKDDYDNLPFGKYLRMLRELKGHERDMFKIKIQEELVMKMNPELNKYFITPRWPVNKSANSSTRYPSTPIRKNLDCILNQGLQFPFGKWFDDM